MNNQSMYTTPGSERVHIAFFGRRNAGKSSLVNVITNQSMSVVSDVKGTTTDPVRKSMEILPIGPVVIIDTPGLDDEGGLGLLRVDKAKEILNTCDIAVYIIDKNDEIAEFDKLIMNQIKEKNIPFVFVINKCDDKESIESDDNDIYIKSLEIKKEDIIRVSAKNSLNIDNLKEKLGRIKHKETKEKPIVADLVEKGDVVVLVTPIDESAPKGRLILPQQLVLRELLDNDVIVCVTKENTYEETLKKLGNDPALVITDSQVFKYVNERTKKDIRLTSFSILMAKYKGILDYTIEGVSAIDDLREGADILIVEGCTHHRQCNDIGTVKIPGWLSDYTGKKFNFHFSSGKTFVDDINKYDLIIHCGGCMLTENEVKNRLETAKNKGVKMTNYGIFIAYINGILKRCVY